jgi:hypothetical protein
MTSIRNFYRQLQQELSVHDVYASMFFCDFINMIIVIIFYSQFGVSKNLKTILINFHFNLGKNWWKCCTNNKRKSSQISI